MEDLDQSNHALDISEMSGIILDPTELKKQGKKKAEPGTINDDQINHLYETLMRQSRQSVSKQRHKGFVKAVLKDSTRLHGYINADFEGDELTRYMDVLKRLSMLIFELVKSDLKAETADGKEGEGPEEQEYGMEVD